ncbi:MAG: sterol desaturase family protein [Planctomycetota bacterium]
MINVLWATHQYWVWLVAISLICFVLERLWPWRKRQRALRRQFAQDLIWLVLNGHYVGIAVAFAGDHLLRSALPALEQLRELELLAAQPGWLQFVVFFLFKDLLEWGVHNLLHRVPLLWHFHKLHHSIEELDWIGNFRFHWMEVVIYKSLTYLPLVILGVDGSVILAIAVVTLLTNWVNTNGENLMFRVVQEFLGHASIFRFGATPPFIIHHCTPSNTSGEAWDAV